MKHYIGTKMVAAHRAESAHGEPGYLVKYADGYESWSPEAVFESAYLEVGDTAWGSEVTKISREVVEGFITSIDYQGRSVYLVTLRNGFTLIEESACVDPDNYDETVAREIVTRKVVDRVWYLLGFMLASAKNGLSS